ncbi:Bax inhibitor-1/YccA family protein [Alloprevotella tannerae]|jgi:membrane protein|uniref:Bax inhibitor-1/YccA family protein n=1 Tax=Alloprevotella tannerae TaxID=76122 RepID=UPI001EDC8E7F|nr:Bax inhibitor-1/YccA family protein [Alloprevotella tannerae]MCG2647427.1 Bax inhibitor-1/YccA family protein [Alloprevotella tannerae]
MEDKNVVNYTSTASRPAAFAALMRDVYAWMALALSLTGLMAMFVVQQPQLLQLIFFNRFVFYGLLLAEVGLVMYLSAYLMEMSFAKAGILFVLYSILNGATLSCVFFVYTTESIAVTFFVTAGMFGALALLGTFIKRDLSSFGRFLYMALIGLIIASVVNLFFASSTLYWITTYAGVFIFIGLTVYDTKKIRELLYLYGEERNEESMKMALIGSLQLYLDFINLFLYLLRIFGRRR